MASEAGAGPALNAAQIAEGRRLLAAATGAPVGSGYPFVWQRWLHQHGSSLLAAADDLARERERAATLASRLCEIAGILNAPMWEELDDDIVCRCDGCCAETAARAATYRCSTCGYEGEPMCWGCRDARNLAEMSEERGERYEPGDILCPVCGNYSLDADPWQAIRSVRVALIGLPDVALAADAPGAGEGGDR